MSWASDLIKKYRQIVADGDDGVPTITGVMVRDQATLLALHEGTWVSGRFDRNIRIDQPTHLNGDGQKHAHVLGRKGDELVIVNLDGSGSHGSKGKLHPDDADALRQRGFKVRADLLVEWFVLEEQPRVLLG